VVNLHKTTRDRHKDEENAKLHEKAIAAKLEDLAGLVAGYGQDATGAGVDAFPIPRKTAAQSLLDECVQRTGSIRGDVYMIESDVSPEFKSVAISRASDNEHPPELDTDSVTYTAFLHGKPTGTARLNPQDTSSAKPDYIYIRNTKTADKELEEAGHRFAHYIECNASVRSELAYPIVADGRRVGALNLESDLVDAYTGGHIAAARKAAEELGQIYLESERRRRASEPLNGYYQKPNELEDLLKKSHLTRAMNHDFILYEIDYENRRLKAHRANDSNDFSWPLDEKQSLARQVFEERRGIYIPDVQKELNSAKPKTKLNGDGVRHFNISGPLFACPVRARGQTEAVLVTWLKPASDPASKDRPGEEIQRWFQSSSAQASRLTNLLANDLYSSEGWRAKAFLERLCHSLTKIDGGWIWTSEMLDNPVFRDGITNALMEALLFEECGLRCVRIWQTSRKGDLAHERIAISSSDGFTCVDSLTLPGSKAPDKKPRKAYEEVWSCEDDEYCRYTIARFSYDPFAQWQHPKMFNKKKDANAEKLDKDPGGSWIVAPIVRPSYGRGAPELLGFISADSHDRSSGTPKYIPESDTRVIALQLRIMDLIAELARHVIAIDVPRSGTVGHG
jgi:hypothetical protein